LILSTFRTTLVVIRKSEMMNEVVVHPRVMESHPEIPAQDALAAWDNILKALPRIGDDPDEYIVIGSDDKGRLIEMVARRTKDDFWVVYRAMTPPTRKALVELGLTRRRR
jgi:hypothetical protein